MLNSPYHGTQFYPGRRLPAVCRDGVTRSAVRTGTGWFDTWPAAVQVYAGGKRRTVSGWFTAGTFEAKGANAGLIPWTVHKPRLAAAALRLIKATAYGHGAPGYIWDYAGDHAAALAGGCRKWAAAAYSAPELGCQATAVFKRLPAELLPRLAIFFDKLAAFVRMEENTPVPPARDLPA